MDFHISLVGLHIASFEEEGVMGNPEHLAKLNEGVEAWNAWRGKTPDIMPDLHGANLCKVDLRGANLSEFAVNFGNMLRASRPIRKVLDKK